MIFARFHMTSAGRVAIDSENLKIHLQCMRKIPVLNSEATQRSWYVSHVSVFCVKPIAWLYTFLHIKTRTVIEPTKWSIEPFCIFSGVALKFLGFPKRCRKVIDAIDDSYLIILTCSRGFGPFYLLGNCYIVLHPSWFKQTCSWLNVYFERLIYFNIISVWGLLYVY